MMSTSLVEHDVIDQVNDENAVEKKQRVQTLNGCKAKEWIHQTRRYDKAIINPPQEEMAQQKKEIEENLAYYLDTQVLVLCQKHGRAD